MALLSARARLRPDPQGDIGPSPELLNRDFALMGRRLAEGSGEENLTGVIDLLVR